MKIRDVFDRSVLIYNKAQDIIKKMSKDVSSEIKKSNLKIKDTAVLFDIVLQYSLIQVAISDSDFNINEMIFISKLTKRGDLLKFLKATKKIDITWDDLYRCSIEGIKNYLNVKYFN